MATKGYYVAQPPDGRGGYTRISVSTTNAESTSFSYDPAISTDVRHVAFV